MFAEYQFRALHGFGISRGDDVVIQLENGFGVGDIGFISLANPGENESGILHQRERFFNRFPDNGGIGHFECPAEDLLAGRFLLGRERFLRPVDFQNFAGNKKAQDDSEDAERVCQAVGDYRAAGIQLARFVRKIGGKVFGRLDRGGHRGRAGERAAEQAGGAGSGDPHDVAGDHGQHAAGQKNQDGDDAETESALAERGKESVAGLEAHRVDKEDHPDYVNVLRQAQAAVQGAEKYSHKEHGGDAQPEAGNVDVADQVADADDYEEQQQRILSQ